MGNSIKTFVIMLAKTFPANHEIAGKPTNFTASLNNAIMCERCRKQPKGMCASECVAGYRKLHTIRSNYDLWEKRFKEIEAGRACLSVREWAGVPYRSKQVEIVRLTSADGIGLQKLTFAMRSIAHPFVDGISSTTADEISQNDGLIYHDWKKWFCKYDLSKCYAIIHFTKFRY